MDNRSNMTTDWVPTTELSTSKNEENTTDLSHSGTSISSTTDTIISYSTANITAMLNVTENYTKDDTFNIRFLVGRLSDFKEKSRILKAKPTLSSVKNTDRETTTNIYQYRLFSKKTSHSNNELTYHTLL